MGRRYKKVEAGHGHHGGAWKVAYADFVTAMMALFMVLWLLASTDAASRKEISNYFRSGILPEGDMAMSHAAQIKPSVIEESATPAPTEEQATIDAKETAAKQISTKLGRLAALDDEMAKVIRNVKIKITPEGVLIETVDEGDNLLFQTSSAKLNEPLERFLRAFAPIVVKIGKPVEINGHTDARQFAPGSKVNNWDLSYLRAAAARQILESNGVPQAQVVGLFARGSSQLYDPANPLAPQNRRLSFLLRIAGNDAKVVRVNEVGDDEGTQTTPIDLPTAAPPIEGVMPEADTHAGPNANADAHVEQARPATTPHAYVEPAAPAAKPDAHAAPAKAADTLAHGPHGK